MISKPDKITNKKEYIFTVQKKINSGNRKQVRFTYSQFTTKSEQLHTVIKFYFT